MVSLAIFNSLTVILFRLNNINNLKLPPWFRGKFQSKVEGGISALSMLMILKGSMKSRNWSRYHVLLTLLGQCHLESYPKRAKLVKMINFPRFYPAHACALALKSTWQLRWKQCYQFCAHTCALRAPWCVVPLQRYQDILARLCHCDQRSHEPQFGVQFFESHRARTSMP